MTPSLMEVDSMANLSPVAQAVLDAANGFNSYSPDDVLNESRWIVAAALRAAADQVVPLPRLPYDSCCDVSASAIRAELMAIAAELEALPND